MNVHFNLLYIAEGSDSDVSVMVFYPENGVSPVQKALMTSVNSPNVKVIGKTLMFICLAYVSTTIRMFDYVSNSICIFQYVFGHLGVLYVRRKWSFVTRLKNVA